MRVLILDDHQLFAEAIRAILEAADIGPVEVVRTGDEAVAAVEARPPDVALIDVMLPGEDGLDVGKRILAESRTTKIVVITALSEPGVLREALARGFHGYVGKDTPAQRFVRVVTAVADGQVVFPQHLSNAVSKGRTPEERDALFLASTLTERERDVLTLLAQGVRGTEISQLLHLSDHTVRKHIQNVMTKLGVHSRLEAVAFAARHRLVSTDRRISV